MQWTCMLRLFSAVTKVVRHNSLMIDVDKENSDDDNISTSGMRKPVQQDFRHYISCMSPTLPHFLAWNVKWTDWNDCFLCPEMRSFYLLRHPPTSPNTHPSFNKEKTFCNRYTDTYTDFETWCCYIPSSNMLPIKFTPILVQFDPYLVILNTCMIPKSLTCLFFCDRWIWPTHATAYQKLDLQKSHVSQINIAVTSEALSNQLQVTLFIMLCCRMSYNES